MPKDAEDMIECRTPTEGKAGVTRIPAWKYHLLQKAILHAVTSAGPEGLSFSALPGALRQRISETDLARLGSLGWHATTVKLNMEVEGQVRRVGGKGPQRLVLAR